MAGILDKKKRREDFFQRDLRPKTLDDFIGQDRVKEVLKLAINGSKASKRPLDHIVFYGYPGLGKTTLAEIIANELSSSFQAVIGSAVSTPGDLASVLVNFEKYQVFFIDEIHRLSKPIEEVLYPCMEDFQIHLVSGSGRHAEPISIPLEAFTLVGATTRMGSLSAPLRDRFGIHLRLEAYDEDALSKIVLRSAKILETEISDEASYAIALNSRGTPRIANRLLKRCIDYMYSSGKEKIEEEDVFATCKILGIKSYGLTDFDLRYLAYLRQAKKPIGLKTLSFALEEDSQTIEEVCEPHLINKGFIEKCPRGRKISSLGLQVLESA